MLSSFKIVFLVVVCTYYATWTIYWPVVCATVYLLVSSDTCLVCYEPVVDLWIFVLLSYVAVILWMDYTNNEDAFSEFIPRMVYKIFKGFKVSFLKDSRHPLQTSETTLVKPVVNLSSHTKATAKSSLTSSDCSSLTQVSEHQKCYCSSPFEHPLTPQSSVSIIVDVHLFVIIFSVKFWCRRTLLY